jgi:hypothetical protein
MSDTLTDTVGTIEIAPRQTIMRDSTLEIGWCLNKRLADELIRQGAVKPMLLITVLKVRSDSADEYPYETVRYLVPLALGRTFVSFSRSGLHRVMATIVWNKSGDEKALRATFMARISQVQYKVEITGYGAQELYSYFQTEHPNDGHFNAQARFDVEVPNGVHAKDPPEWWSQFMLKFFRNDPFDQCESRKRFLLFGWYALPLFLLTTTPLRLIIAAVRLFFGVQKTKWWAIIRPFKYRVSDIAVGPQYSRWFCKSETYRRKGGFVHVRQPLWRMFVNPPVQVTLWMLVFVVASFKETKDSGELAKTEPWLGYGLWKSLIVAVSLQIAVVAVIFALAAVSAVVRILSRIIPRWSSKDMMEPDRISDRKAATRRQREAAAAEASVSRERQLLERLICNTAGPTAERKTVDLPRDLKFKLAFDRVKNWACRPYQR